MGNAAEGAAAPAIDPPGAERIPVIDDEAPIGRSEMTQRVRRMRDGSC